MNKLTILLFASVLVLTSCDNTTDPGGTAVQNMSGDWWVTYEHSYEEYDYLLNGVGEMPSPDTLELWNFIDVYEVGHTQLLTFNVASNASDTMFISDEGNFYDLLGKIPVKYSDLTFGGNDSIPNLAYDVNVVIKGGKILKGAATTPSGTHADSIVFYLGVPDDQYGFTYIKVSGFRRTGFSADDFE